MSPTRAELRHTFNDSTARKLVRAATGEDSTKLRPASDISARFSYLAAENELIVAAGPQEEEHADLALAYGLSLRERQNLESLALLLPQCYARPTRLRLAWVDVPVRLFEYDEARRCRYVPPASVEEAIEAARDPYPARAAYDLGDAQQFVQELVAWADEDERLSRDDRTRYAAWYHDGMLILKIEKAGSGLRLTAGLDSSKLKREQAGALKQIVEERLIPDALEDIKAAVEHSVATYAGLPEARFQSFLYRNPHLVDADPAGMQREVPATRPRGRGFVDFLAKNAAREICLIETKIGPDPMVVLQAVDYWAWGCGLRQDLASKLGLESDAPLVIEIVTAADAKGKTLDAHAVPIAKALTPALRLRLLEVHSWNALGVDAPNATSRTEIHAAAEQGSATRR
jgi:hypothetical protein